MGLKLFAKFRKDAPPKEPAIKSRSNPIEPQVQKTYEPSAPMTLDDDPLRAMLTQGRGAAIWAEADRWRAQPGGADALARACESLEAAMALVPAGDITLNLALSTAGEAKEETRVVEPFLLDVCCVTQEQFQQFVDAGGYDDLNLWPEDIWPHLIEMKDQTGMPAPRYWREARHDRRFSRHPVVGVCWYEAQAYARWIGKRLPNEAEWQMACSWHIKSEADVLRRFPWGDAMNTQRCNIWLSGVGGTVPVDAYPSGAAPNHVLQLVGNVWEWTASPFEIHDPEGHPIVGEMPMLGVRGGAFDTYFESQTASQFRTGQIALARTHNLGFRCAIDLAAARWMNEG